ncbi:hypothetical protein SAMN05444320_109207 [Streptoalloteichus hindustanus]|uniref:PA containing protein n=2 Tax=Streptoalloteichus hindustanus TaxID=2017 RepID=A0A1M5KAP6_STRHI|nr:hypothetical protein SAMN05444320_109207 [Streptoalloteichus hindustanus]
MNENNHAALSFDRMRSMLTRAAEIRESEQQQIFDALDEIHARLSPLESLGSVRKRLSELPDRTEVSVLAERLDEALARLETQDGAISALGRAVDGLVDKLAKPFAQLDGRLDGVAGRFEGVAGRMDGLEDRIAGLHKRLDDINGRFDKTDLRLDGLPSAVHGPVRDRLETLETALRSRIDEVDEGMHEHLDGTREAVQRSVAESGEAVQRQLVEAGEALRRHVTESGETVQRSLSESVAAVQRTVDEASDALRGSLTETRDAVTGRIDELDGTRLDSLAQRLEQLTTRLNDVAGRIDQVEDGVGGRIGELAGTVRQGLSRIDESLADRPDQASLVSLVRTANEESERRQAGQLDEAMATFAELILGGGAPAAPPAPTTLPRPQRRAARGKSAKRDSDKALDDLGDLGAESA